MGNKMQSKSIIKPVIVNRVPKNLESVLKGYGVMEIYSSTHVVELKLLFLLESENKPSRTNSNARMFVLNAESFELISTILHCPVPGYLV